MRNKLLGFGAISAIIATLACYNTYAFNNLSTITYPYYAFVEDPESPWASVWDALDATGTIQYSDEFFNEASPGVHPELRVASYALALAGFENRADGYPASETNSKLYTMLNELGFSNPKSWDVASEANGHSMGTTIAHKTINNGQNLIAVIPRSYNYMTEWLSNFNVGTTGDHAGFNESANLIITRLKQYISDHNLRDNKIWIVGYSRGGAVMDLAAKKINQNLTPYNASADNLYAYTFGAPKASLAKTEYSNIHDVKDGNDLLLGYLFPDQWGFYNTGTYEEIHDADLEIPTYSVDISDLIDSSKAANLLANNNGLTIDMGNKNGKEFMDEWLQFITTHGLTREYFNSTIKPPLSEIMKALQLRTIDKQSDFSGFITDSSHGMLAMVAQSAFLDLMMNSEGSSFEEKLNNFLPYQYLVKILKGTATNEEIGSLANSIKGYISEYDDYENRLGVAPPITEDEFRVVKENIPELIKALGPLLVADAKYTQETYGENASLYYGYTLISNFNNLVYGHIPESIMPILKAAISPASDPGFIPAVPDSGFSVKTTDYIKETSPSITFLFPVFLVVILYLLHRHAVRKTPRIIW